MTRLNPQPDGVEEGDKVRVEYGNVRGNRSEQTGTVRRVDERDTHDVEGGEARLVYVYLDPDGGTERDDYYTDDDVPARRYAYISMPADDENDASEWAVYKGRNGGRWNRLSRGDVGIEVVEKFEDPERESLSQMFERVTGQALAADGGEGR